jgi:hypothetical protein
MLHLHNVHTQGLLIPWPSVVQMMKKAVCNKHDQVVHVALLAPQ